MSILESLMFITGKHGPGVDGDATVSCLPLGMVCACGRRGTDARLHRHFTPVRPWAVATGSRAPGALRDAGGPCACKYDGQRRTHDPHRRVHLALWARSTAKAKE